MKETRKYTGNLARMFRKLFTLVPHLFLLVTAIAVVDAVLPYVNVIVIQLVIDGLAENRGARAVAWVVAAAVAVNVLSRLVLGELRKRREVSEARLDLKFQEYLHLHEMRLPLADIESTRVQELKRNIEQAKMRDGGVENIVSDFETVIRSVTSLITAGVVFLRIFAMQQGGAGLSFWTSPVPVAILVFLVIACTLATLKLQSAQNVLIAGLNDEVNQANGSAFAYMQFISNYHFGKEIRVFGLGSYLCDFFENLWTSSIGYRLMQKLGREKAKIPCVTVLCNGILNMFIYILAIGKAYAGEISVGNVVVYINSVQAFIQAMVALVGSGGEIVGHGALMQPFLDLLDMEEDLPASGRDTEMPAGIGDIAFEHVYFKYPGQEDWVLEDVSFVLKSGQKMALVGENGAGKSTLIKLACRFYEPDRGCIKINGVDVRQYSKEQYWKMVGAVFQDFSLPALSLGNVISGEDGYDKAREDEILREVGMDRWMAKLGISYDKCLYNDFSDSGIEISGGEGQKLAIARAIYKGAPFMILDEPTAALDPISEAAIFNDFHRVCEGKTCIFISHRLYSCRICDFILVLHEGRLAQQGTHEELLGRSGKYKELWDAQAGLYKEASGL